MPLQKNQILTLRIERLSSDGSGVAHSPDGETVFVPGAAPGDEADVRIVKDCKRYAFGILDHLRTPSPDRIPVDCAVAGPCGGCSLRHLDYTAELRAKQENVTDAFRRIGGLDVPVLDICPSPEVDRYRNKVQFPVGLDKDGNPCIGFYAGRTHRIVPCPDCKLQPGVLNDIGNALCRFFAENGIQPYNEETGRGLVRHIFLRRGAHSGQIMVCLVCTRPNFPHAEALCTRLREQFADIATILLNVNSKNTNVILGTETHTLYGPGYIEDTLCGVPVQLGPLSFYQVNTLAAERLYGIAAQYAQLTPDDLLLDLYCGMGTIGLVHGGPLPGAGGRGDRARSHRERQGQRRPHGGCCGRKELLLLCRRRAGGHPAGRRGPAPGRGDAGPAPQGLRRGHPLRRGAHGSPPGGLRQLQPRHRRPRCRLAGAKRLSR